MKKFGVLVSLLLLSVATAFAETATLIDFSEMVKDDGEHNTATLIDFAEYAGTEYSEEQKAMFKESLAIERWGVTLNGSVRSIERDRLSLAKEVQSNFLGTKVMGVRVNFPKTPSNQYATIQPPFSIPSLMPADDSKIEDTDIFSPKKFDNKGSLRNVGVLKNLSVTVRGLGFKHQLSILLKNGKGEIEEIRLGDLNFTGWRTITWKNIDYVRDVRERDLKLTNKYPSNWPSLTLQGFRVYRSSEDTSSDFIVYIKDVNVTYDKVMNEEDMKDMSDDDTWRIIKDNEILAYRAQIEGMIDRIIVEYDAEQLRDKTDEGEDAPLQISGEPTVKSKPYNPDAAEGNKEEEQEGDK